MSCCNCTGKGQILFELENKTELCIECVRTLAQLSAIIPFDGCEKPAQFVAPVHENDDAELTCMFCGGVKCDLVFIVRGGGRNVWNGFHKKCGTQHIKEQS